MKVTLIFKGGAVFKLTADKFSVTRNALGETTKASWENAKPDILRLDLSELAAVFVEDK